jgi:hypothetical protein
MWIALRIGPRTELESGFLTVQTSVWMIGTEVMIDRLTARWKAVTIGIPGTTGTAVNQDGEIVGLSASRIVRRSGPSNGLWTIATARAVVVVVVVVVVDNGIQAVATEAAVGTSGITGISAHKAVVVVAVAVDIASSRAAATIRSAIRIMGVAVVARTARVNSRRPRRSRWCRRSR